MLQSKLVKLRPILLIETNGAQNEARCFPKTSKRAVDLFCLLDCDVLLHQVDAVGLPAGFYAVLYGLPFPTFYVERRMTPFSDDLARIVLPCDHLLIMTLLEKQLSVRWRRKTFKSRLRYCPKFGKKW